MSKKYICGIDPDLDKNGVAVWNRETKYFDVLTAMDIGKLFDTLRIYRPDEILIRVDSGWLTAVSNYHLDQGQRRREKIANNVGQNAGVGKTIVALLCYKGYEVEQVKPVKSKTTFDTFHKITNNTYQDNFKKLMTFKQEIIDAGMLCYGY